VKKISRIVFIKKLWALLLLPYALFAWMTIKKNRQLYSKQKVRISSHIPKGVSFFDDVIVVKSSGRIRVFSSHCTHLGCTLNKLENEELHCPCHGSVFTTDGRVVRGPAAENLKELSFQVNSKTDELIIDL